MKILITIANFGTKNDGYLEASLAQYRSLPHDTDIVVLTNLRKGLGPDVEVRVGLPTKDPRSLPFAHKRVMAERIDNYDLFIYAEDDTPISNRNILAFLDATAVLNEDEIAGFVRTEIGSDGTRYFPDALGCSHWDPSSVVTRGEHTFAAFSNEHSANFVLTRAQLRNAIDSTGFLVEPHEGKYGLLETAATDVYAQCGFTKLICISHLDDFLVPHLANKYLSLQGSEFFRQIAALLAINRGERPASQLLQSEEGLPGVEWCKSYYEPASERILELLPAGLKTVLSIGCGWGELEGRMVQKGIRVVGIGLDGVISACAEARGVEMVIGDLDTARKALANECFDCVVISNLLNAFREPLKVLQMYTELLSPGGAVLVREPNLGYLKVVGRRSLRRLRNKHRWNDRNRDVGQASLDAVKDWLRKCGLVVDTVVDVPPARLQPLRLSSFGFAGRWLAREFIARAHSSLDVEQTA